MRSIAAKFVRFLHRLGLSESFQLRLISAMRAFQSVMMSGRFGRETLYNALPAGTLTIWSSDSERYILNSSDKVIGLSIFRENKAFDVEKLKMALEFLPKDHSKEVIFDVGANIGTIGIHSLLNGYFQRCVAFEPEPNNYRLLTANVALNGLAERFVTHNAALSDRANEVLRFELSESNHGDHRIRVSDAEGNFNESGRRVIQVKCACLNDFSEQLSADSAFIWMDTQGFEGRVLAGGSKVIENRVPMVFEFWPYGLRRSENFDLLVSILENSKYQTLIDLNDPGTHRQLSRESLIEIADRIGYSCWFTDLMVF